MAALIWKGPGRRRAGQDRAPLGQAGGIPQAAVLFGGRQAVAVGADPGGAAGGGQQHHRQRALDLGGVGGCGFEGKERLVSGRAGHLGMLTGADPPRKARVRTVPSQEIFSHRPVVVLRLRSQHGRKG